MPQVSDVFLATFGAHYFQSSMKHIFCSLTYFFLLFFAFDVKSQNQQPKKLVVGFYNLENLYDTIRDPSVNDEDFTPSGKLNWNSARYQQKIIRLGEVISQLGSVDGPDVLGVCEVENKKVLEDLVLSPKLSKLKYAIAHHNSPDERGIDVALLYKGDKSSFISQKAYSVVLQDPKDRTRDVLLVSLGNQNDTIHYILCHLPSRRGGAETSSPDRMAAALVARHVADSLFRINVMAKVIIMGDMNDEPENESMTKGLMTTGSYDSVKVGIMYNAMASLALQGNGSYMHNRKWNMLDQMILSAGFMKAESGFMYEPVSASVFKPEFIQETNEKYKGSPWRTYAGQKYLGGYSDHFPVFASFKYEAKKVVPAKKKTKKTK